MNAFKQLSVGVALSVAAGFAVAAARGTDDVPQVTVSYADLNLRHADGVAHLYRRLEAAAAEVCPAINENILAVRVRRKACMDEAIGRAVAAVGEPKLTRYHQAKTAPSRPRAEVARK